MEIEELWKPVVGWERSYEVSSQGRLRSIDRTVEYIRAGQPRTMRLPQRLLKPPVSIYGYHFVILSEEPRRKTVTIHILVCEAFHGSKPDPTWEVAHLNGTRADNRSENLRWVSPKENQSHRVAHGTHIRGEDIVHAVMSEITAKEILERFRAGTRQRDLMREFGFKRGTIWALVRGKSWKHLHQS